MNKQKNGAKKCAVFNIFKTLMQYNCDFINLPLHLHTQQLTFAAHRQEPVHSLQTS